MVLCDPDEDINCVPDSNVGTISSALDIDEIATAESEIFGAGSTLLFGAAVNGDPDTGRLIVGGFIGQGTSHVFEKQGDALVETFRFNVFDAGIDETGDAKWGRDVFINGDLFIDGSEGAEAVPPAGANDGAAWIVINIAGTWTPEERIQSPSPVSGRKFAGRGCAIADDPNGSFAVAGESGSVHIYRDAGGGSWPFEQTISKSWTNFNGFLSAQPGMWLGGATGEGVGGKAFVYEDLTGSGTWTEKELVPDVPVPSGAAFGIRTSIHGDLAIVGATGSNEVYIFRRDTDGVWSQEAKFEGDSGFAQDLAIADRGNGVGVATACSSSSTDVSVFESSNNVWELVGVVNPTPDVTGDAFGDSSGMTNDFIVVGSPLDDDAGSDAGKAFVWQLLS